MMSISFCLAGRRKLKKRFHITTRARGTPTLESKHWRKMLWWVLLMPLFSPQYSGLGETATRLRGQLQLMVFMQIHINPLPVSISFA